MNARDGVGRGAEHGAQGYGFHKNFHSGPAIVFPPKSFERELSHVGAPSRVQNVLAYGPTKSTPQTGI